MISFVCVFLQQYLGWNSSLTDYMENYRVLPVALNSLMCHTQHACSLNCPDGVIFFPLTSSEKGFHCSIPGGASSSYLQQTCQHSVSFREKVQYWGCTTLPWCNRLPFLSSLFPGQNSPERFPFMLDILQKGKLLWDASDH